MSGDRAALPGLSDGLWLMDSVDGAWPSLPWSRMCCGCGCPRPPGGGTPYPPCAPRCPPDAPPGACGCCPPPSLPVVLPILPPLKTSAPRPRNSVAGNARALSPSAATPHSIVTPSRHPDGSRLFPVAGKLVTDLSRGESWCGDPRDAHI